MLFAHDTEVGLMAAAALVNTTTADPDGLADTSALDQTVGYRPATTVREGVGRFVDWYQAYYGQG